jgi:hypothetical protein
VSTQPTNSLLANLAERCASHPKLEGAVLGAVRQILPGVILSVLREQFPGETIRLYVPKIERETRKDRDARIAQALAAGKSVATIMDELGLPKTTVHRVKSRRRGIIGST